MFLREFTNSIDAIKGIGSATALLLKTAGVRKIRDLFLYYPRAYEDRTVQVPFCSIGEEGTVNTVVVVKSHSFIGYGKKRTLKIQINDDTESAFLVCFGRNFLASTLTVGSRFYLYGFFSRRLKHLQSSAFDIEPFSEAPKYFNKILPVYPLVGRLSQSFFRKKIADVCRERGQDIDNELPERLMAKRGLTDKSSSISNIHFPETRKLLAQSRRTLIYEELFYLQLAIRQRTQKARSKSRRPIQLSRELVDLVVPRLPFALTRDQTAVLEEIQHDMESAFPMGRLLQGDVGCGKTLVALLSSLLRIGAGTQVALMAPTELLAGQHAEKAAEILEPAGVSVAFLSGNVKQEGRRNLLQALSRGEIDLLIGTHALFTKDVKFRDLGLVIVDEQHRFGVLQRIMLLEKGISPDLLLMTATPIPRTLALTIFGDLDTSTIRTMPPGRKPIDSHLVRKGNEKKVYNWIRKEVEKGRQAYFVYPLIQQSEKLDLKDAESMYNHLAREVFPDMKIALIHSKVNEERKKETMHQFALGNINILVATSIVEVGVNVPNATCMVIEQAERFGLTALHQLRGRVGRADFQSYTFLVYGDSITEDAKQRLMVMKNSNDGFYIAEEDLRIRGPGELTGFRQSGYLRLTIADLVRDLDIMISAREDVTEILEKDPELSEPENRTISEVVKRVPPFTDAMIAGG